MQRVERLIRPRTATGGVIATYGHSKFSKTKRNVQSAKSDGHRLLKLAQVGKKFTIIDTKISNSGCPSLSL